MKWLFSFGCLTSIGLFILQICLGGLSVSYILSWFGKSIPFLYDMIIGLFVAEFSIPVAIGGWILRCFGVF